MTWTNIIGIILFFSIVAYNVWSSKRAAKKALEYEECYGEHQYLELMEFILDVGTLEPNRTGIDCWTIPGAMLKFDMADGFPLLTTKKTAFKVIKSELEGFVKAFDNAGMFRNLGCKIWDANANENKTWLANPNRKGEDDLGAIYGVQWRGWDTGDGNSIDQLKNAVELVMKDPGSRRNIITAWNPSAINKMALPPCHLMFQLIPHKSTKTLHMTMYQRSCDMFLGIPFNIASYALLLEVIAKFTGYKPGELTMFLADCHIYQNHIDQVKEQLSRKPFKFPTLDVSSIPSGYGSAEDFLNNLDLSDVKLVDYYSHEAIKAPMAV